MFAGTDVNRGAVVVALAFGCLALPAQAPAATLDVCPVGCTYASISVAVTAASPFDTVNVAAGTYNETQVLVNQPLTLHGAGRDQSIIDGGNAVGLPTGGTVRVDTAAGDVTMDGFTIRHAGTGGGTRVALFEKASAPGPAFTFTDIEIV